MPVVKPIAAIVCDDIRQEKTNKEILIGVYSNELIIHKTPARLRLSVFVLVDVLEIGETAFEIRLDGPDGPSEHTIRGGLEGAQSTPPRHRIGLPFKSFFITLASEGDLLVKFREPGKRWRTIAVLPVLIAKDTISVSTETQQPS